MPTHAGVITSNPVNNPVARNKIDYGKIVAAARTRIYRLSRSLMYTTVKFVILPLLFTSSYMGLIVILDNYDLLSPDSTKPVAQQTIQDSERTFRNYQRDFIIPELPDPRTYPSPVINSQEKGNADIGTYKSPACQNETGPDIPCQKFKRQEMSKKIRKTMPAKQTEA